MKRSVKLVIGGCFAVISLTMTGCHDSKSTLIDNNSRVGISNSSNTPEPSNPSNTPAPSNSSNTPELSNLSEAPDVLIPTPKSISEWQSKLTVEIASEGLKNSAATFGQKEDAQDGIDSTDLKALPAPEWGQGRLDVLFVIDGKMFNTVFQKLTDKEIQKETLLIQTNKEGKSVTIHFNGISELTSVVDSTGRKIYTAHKASKNNKLLERMKLIDSVAGVEIPFIKEGKLQTYNFTMNNDEKERKFSIILNTQKLYIDYAAVPQSRSVKRTILKPHNMVKAQINLDAPLDME